MDGGYVCWVRMIAISSKPFKRDLSIWQKRPIDLLVPMIAMTWKPIRVPIQCSVHGGRVFDRVQRAMIDPTVLAPPLRRRSRRRRRRGSRILAE